MARKYPRVLLIGGNARKAGKTSFVCNIVKKFGGDNPLVALKISLYTDRQVLQAHYELEEDQDYYEIRETKASGEKDSSRYVEAGAMEGWFIAAMEDKKSAAKIMKRIEFLIESDRLLIIESNRMRKCLEPGLFLMVNKQDKEDKSGAKSFQQMADMIVEPDSVEFNDIERYIGIEEKKWILKKDDEE